MFFTRKREAFVDSSHLKIIRHTNLAINTINTIRTIHIAASPNMNANIAPPITSSVTPNPKTDNSVANSAFSMFNIKHTTFFL